MTSAAEILTHALALSPKDRATIAHSLLQSLPAPRLYSTEEELAREVQLRLQANESRPAELFDARDTLQRARDAVVRVHNS